MAAWDRIEPTHHCVKCSKLIGQDHAQVWRTILGNGCKWSETGEHVQGKEFVRV